LLDTIPDDLVWRNRSTLLAFLGTACVRTTCLPGHFSGTTVQILFHGVERVTNLRVQETVPQKSQDVILILPPLRLGNRHFGAYGDGEVRYC
jgi:hypothetical protein